MTGQFGTSQAIPPASGASKPNRRLDSWKEIAAFFGRDERTVKRWEKERSLPVHRLPGGSRARVFAFTEELERWMSSLESASAQESVADATVGVVGPPVLDDSPKVGILASAGEPKVSAKRNLWYWVIAACAVLALAVVVGWRYRAGHPATITPPVKAATHPVNPEAEELYLKGRYYWTRRTPADLNQAVDLFTQAIIRDPSYAQPYVGLADCYNLLREFAAMPPSEAFPRALAAAKKAVELDDNSAEAHASLAFVTYYWSWDAAGAEAEFRRAIELNPHYVVAHHWYATFLMSEGRFEESTKEFEIAQKLDPASTPILADKGLLLMSENRLDEAEALLKQVEASQPDFFSAHQYLSYVYFAKHDDERYLKEARQAAQLSRNDVELAIVRASEQGYRAGGERGLLEHRLALQKKYYDQGKVSPFHVAETTALLGERQDAMRYLQRAYRLHDEGFLAAPRNPNLASLHDDPEFRKLLTEAGLNPHS
jgi:tetratricopeptide (TPR) repeat protein